MVPLKILLVDDEKNIRQTLNATLTAWGHEVMVASTVDEALRVLRSEAFDFVLTDFKLENKSGIEVIQKSKQLATPPVTALMTAFASYENAVSAIKEGAYDYLPKPFSNAQLEHLIQRIGTIVELRRENEKLKSAQGRLDYFAGQTSPAMVRLEEFVKKVGPTEASILLVGESGTGKTELANLIHACSPRARKSFGVVNCTTLTEALLESELFGHVKGAFTGATQDHIGKLEAANHGTILIDEVGDLSLAGQMKLLRFLQEKVIERVGSNKNIALDVRVIAATNRNLEEAVRDGKFRQDLYYRLNIFESALVPLRFRKEDIAVLAQKFYRQMMATSGVLNPKPLPETLSKVFIAHSWPGNVRELKNVIERLVILSRGREPTVDDLPESVKVESRAGIEMFSGNSKDAIFRSLEELEREQIERILRIEPSQEKAAEILGITTVTLWRKRKQYGLP